MKRLLIALLIIPTLANAYSVESMTNKLAEHACAQHPYKSECVSTFKSTVKKASALSVNLAAIGVEDDKIMTADIEKAMADFVKSQK